MGYSKEKIKEYNAKRNEDITKYALESLRLRKLIDQTKWKYFCNRIRNGAENNKYPYSNNFTDDMIFEMMSEGCYYCEDIATTIDRVDSSIGHIQENCVGSCWPCNMSKGNGDHDSFLRKAYYRTEKEYFDDDIDIWSDNIHKPSRLKYEKKAIRQEVVFDLTKDHWDIIVRGDCAYCLRSLSSKKYNGVDRVIPSGGYTLSNVVSCCDDCNRDKGMLSVESMKIRNEKITERMRNGNLVITNCSKVLQYNGKNPSSKKVCVRGKLYQSNAEASRGIGMEVSYVSICLRDGRYSDDIFIVSDEFYKEYKNIEVYITKSMFIGFEHYLSSL